MLQVANEQIVAFLHHAEAKILICDKQVSERLKSQPNLNVTAFCWDDVEWKHMTEIEPSSWSDLVLPTSPEELRTLLFTSGSTGAPKCAMLSEKALLKEFVRLDFWRPVQYMSFSPFSYSSSRLTLYNVLGNGGRLTLYNGDMMTFFDQIRISNVSGFSAPPRIW